MRLSLALLLPAIAGVAQAATAFVQGLAYGELFDNDALKNRHGLVITPRQLRLVVAANLDLSQYHALTDESREIDTTTVDVINQLVQKDQRTLYDDIDDLAALDPGRYLAVVRGSSEEIEAFKKWNRKNVKRGFPFSLPESSVRLEDLDRLVADLKTQAETTDSEIYEFDLSVRIIHYTLHSYSNHIIEPRCQHRVAVALKQVPMELHKHHHSHTHRHNHRLPCPGQRLWHLHHAKCRLRKAPIRGSNVRILLYPLCLF